MLTHCRLSCQQCTDTTTVCNPEDCPDEKLCTAFKGLPYGLCEDGRSFFTGLCPPTKCGSCGQPPVGGTEKAVKASNGKECVFPFHFRGMKHVTCTGVDTDAKYHWCSTTTDEEAARGEYTWGKCPEESVTKIFQCSPGGAWPELDNQERIAKLKQGYSQTYQVQIATHNNADMELHTDVTSLDTCIYY